MQPLQCFQEYTPDVVCHQCDKSQCHFALNSTGCDHDAAPNTILQKADRAFLQVISCFTFPLKGHQASYVEIIPHKSKG